MLSSTFTVSPSHKGAVKSALATAADTCQALGVEFTEVRRGLLEILWEVGQPLGAYDLLPRLEGALGRRFGPPTVYRGLEFLRLHGFIKRIESQNAYIACAHADRAHSCIFFVCTSCGATAEMENPTVEKLLVQDSRTLRFEISRRVIELEGTCVQCRIVV